MPDRNGSSEKLSNARPFSGLRWMLTVGARSMVAPLALLSSARRAPASYMRSRSNDAPRHVAEGIQVEGVGLKWDLPLTPFCHHQYIGCGYVSSI